MERSSRFLGRAKNPLATVPFKQKGKTEPARPKQVQEQLKEQLPRDSTGSSAPELLRVEVGEMPNGTPLYHTILKTPSAIDGSHIVFPSNIDDGRLHSTYNLVMMDASSSMKNIFPYIVKEWNEIIAPDLQGDTDIYTFSERIQFRRPRKTLDQNDFENANTNFSEAIKKVGALVNQCPHKHVRVFFITDGMHKADNTVLPETVIDELTIPTDKRIEVYLLGVLNEFPVEISISLRSKLHTGAAGVPTLFWVQNLSQLKQKMLNIKQEVRDAVLIKLSIPAKIAPFLEETRDYAYPGEYLYYDMHPQVVLSSLKLNTMKETRFKADHDWKKCTQKEIEEIKNDRNTTDDATRESEIAINKLIRQADASILLNNLFKQWCSILTQMHQNKKPVPMELFDFMRTVFENHMKYESLSSPDDPLKIRIHKKSAQALKTEFGTMVNECRDIISMETKFENEIALADEVLKTTVQSKHDLKLMKIRGYGDADWTKALNIFRQKYEAIEEQIKALPDPDPEDCCRILMRSFLSDLQDPEFKDLLSSAKANFLAEVTFTGIPIFSPVTNASQINPWTQCIKNICRSPFEIMSQRAMECQMAVDATNQSSPHKEIQLQQDDPGTTFNVIVPIIPQEHAELLKPLVRTDVFAVGCTFCILKNALIIDHNCHIASLGCVWMETIKSFPLKKRPEYIKNRIANIAATASLYLDRPSIQRYITYILRLPRQAVATQLDEYDGIIKTESLVKPAFFLFLIRDDIALLQYNNAKIPLLVQRVLAEFLGRCITSYDSLTPFTDFYLPTVSNGPAREEWLEKKSQKIYAKLNTTGKELLKRFYDPFSLRRGLSQEVAKIMAELKDELQWERMCAHESRVVQQARDRARKRRLMRDYRRSDSPVSFDGSDMEECSDADEPMDEGGDEEAAVPLIDPVINMKMVINLRNTGSAGHIGWQHLRAWANEMLHYFGPQPQAAEGGGAAVGGPPGAPADHPTGAAGGGSDTGSTSTHTAKQAPVEERPVFLTQQDINHAFSSEMMNMYLVHAINHRASTDRAENDMISPEECKALILKKLKEEWKKIIRLHLRPRVLGLALEAWLEEYHSIHDAVALPMSRQQIIQRAQRLGVQVTEENFDEVYRNWDADVRLCRNCCHMEDCPYFLIPNKRYNCHLEPGRDRPNFPHALHISVARTRPDAAAAVQTVRSGSDTGTHNRQKTDKMLSFQEAQIVQFVDDLMKKFDDSDE